MKIYSYSETPPKQPYYHLGYLATTTVRANRPLLGIGLPLFLLGTILACKVVTSKGNWRKSIGIVFKKEGKWVKPGIVTLIIGCVFIVMAFAFGKTVWAHADYVTYSNMQEFADISYSQVISKHEEPLNLEKLESLKIPRNPQFQDGWYNTMQIRMEMKEGKQVFYIASAGKDEEFGNDDDIRFDLSEYWAKERKYEKKREQEKNSYGE